MLDSSALRSRHLRLLWDAYQLGSRHSPLPALNLAAHAKTAEDDGTLLKLYGDFETRAEQGKFQPYRESVAAAPQFGTEFGFTPSPDELRSLAASLPNWKPWPDTVGALHRLKARFRLVILSNVDDDLFAGMRPKLGVEFDEVIMPSRHKPTSHL